MNYENTFDSGKGSYHSFTDEETKNNDHKKNVLSKSAKLIVIGPLGSGKTSIVGSVFKIKIPCKHSCELRQKYTIHEINYSVFVKFTLYEITNEETIDRIFWKEENLYDCNVTIIFIIDSKIKNYQPNERDYICRIISSVYEIDNNSRFEVFIHKTDGLNHDQINKVHFDSRNFILDSFTDSFIRSSISFHNTSIYNHSVFEVFSVIIRRNISHIYTLGSLLDLLVQNSVIDNAFLIDIPSKLYIATDSSPFDITSYEISCDVIDSVYDLSFVFNEQESWIKSKAYKNQTSSTIRLFNSNVIYLKSIGRSVCIIL